MIFYDTVETFYFCELRVAKSKLFGKLALHNVHVRRISAISNITITLLVGLARPDVYSTLNIRLAARD